MADSRQSTLRKTVRSATTNQGTPLTTIQGIGLTFARDLRRIDIHSVEMLKGRKPEQLFEKLVAANESVGHGTSKNYLYVLRLAVYAAEGGADPALLKWSAWSDKAVAKRAGVSSAG